MLGAAQAGVLASYQFSPLELFAAGEQGVWYDPSDFSTLFQDSAGTTPVTAVDQYVGKILDKSGRGNHATQSNNTKRPQLKIGADGKYYLLFDGSNYALATGNINFTATDKMTVLAGIKKLSDSITIIAELSPNAGVNNGSFFLAGGPATTGSDRYGFYSRGTAGTSAKTQLTKYNAPNISVLTGMGSIPGDSAILRVNSVQADLIGTGDQGTGNYGNYPLYIGARAGSDLYSTGHLYSLIVRGAATAGAQLLNAERYVGQQTGIAL